MDLGVLGGRDYSESDISEATFRDVFLPPFIAGIRAGAVSIMSAFQALEGRGPSVHPFGSLAREKHVMHVMAMASSVNTGHHFWFCLVLPEHKGD